MAMTVYIEYAFLENFFFDGVLLSLALAAARAALKWRRIAFSAAIGGGFALVYPFLQLPSPLLLLLKISVGFLLCRIAYGGIKTKKQAGKYALSTAFFFIFSFSFGGALLGVSGKITVHNPFWVLLGFAALTAFAVLFIQKLYQKRAVYAFLYECALKNGEKTVRTTGFYDSGNQATKNGLPVCFVSPDLIYDLFFEGNIEKSKQVYAEMSITTIVGEKKTAIYKGKIRINGVEKEVYFAPSRNMISREYKILLNARIFEG